MIEDELRTLLSDRAGGLPDNPTRVADVRSRIGAARRRRAAGTALTLVLLAIAGLVLTRLPGRPDALPLPTGVPPGPWFRADAAPSVAGYVQQDVRTTDGRPVETYAQTYLEVSLRYLVVARCQERGPLVVRNTGPTGPVHRLDCSRPTDGGYEGVLVFEPAAAEELLRQNVSSGGNVRYEPGTGGRWEVALLAAAAPDALLSPGSSGPYLVDGEEHPDGTTVSLTIPRRSTTAPADFGFEMRLECVAGVQLTLTVAGGTLAVLTCDPLGGRLEGGTLAHFVSQQTLDRLGLRRGRQVALTVRSTGRQTDQWRLRPVSG